MTTTWSPEFRCGVKVGLCLPRRIAATPEARRPSTWSVASTTYQSLFRSAAFAVHVFCLLILPLVVRPALLSKSLPSRSARPRGRCAAPAGGPAPGGYFPPIPEDGFHVTPRLESPRDVA